MNILELVEAPARFEVLKPTEELIETDDFIVFFGEGEDARSCSVQRPRFENSSLESIVSKVRAQVKEKGRTGVTWEVVSPPHSRSTLDALLRLGMEWGDPPSAVIMALSSEPPRGNPAVCVTPVHTVEEFKTYVSITHEVFGMLDRLPGELARIDERGSRDLEDRSFLRFVARIGDRPVGAAAATFTGAGVMLHAGATLEEFRGRGVYTTLVAHRWQEALTRGTPNLITRAGRMSCPILRKLGFDEIGEVHFLVDSVQQHGKGASTA